VTTDGIHSVILLAHFPSYKKLSYRRETARRAVSKFVLCFTMYGSYKGFKKQK